MFADLAFLTDFVVTDAQIANLRARRERTMARTVYTVKVDGKTVLRTYSFKDAVRRASNAQSDILRTGVGYGKRVQIETTDKS